MLSYRRNKKKMNVIPIKSNTESDELCKICKNNISKCTCSSNSKKKLFVIIKIVKQIYIKTIMNKGM